MDDRNINRGSDRNSEKLDGRDESRQESLNNSPEVHEVVREISGGIDSSVEAEGNVAEENRKGNEGYEPGAKADGAKGQGTQRVFEPPAIEKMIADIEGEIHQRLMTISVKEKKLLSQKSPDNRSLNDVVIEKRRLHQILNDLRNKAIDALKALWYQYVLGKK